MNELLNCVKYKIERKVVFRDKDIVHHFHPSEDAL